MTTNVFAGSVSDYHWTGTAFALGKGDGPCFTIRTLNYWEVQGILAEQDDTAKVRKALEAGLVEIDGSADGAKAFIANPAPRLVNPLFELIWSTSMGN